MLLCPTGLKTHDLAVACQRIEEMVIISHKSEIWQLSSDEKWAVSIPQCSRVVESEGETSALKKLIGR